MERKILFFVIGLMSLIATTSCDKITFNDDGEFMPVGYIVKSPDSEADISSGVVSTLQIMGIRGLVFDEVEKSDWKIITQPEVAFKGETRLEFEENPIEIELKGITELLTNFDEDISIAFGNTTVFYTYMGNQVELEPIDKVYLSVKIDEKQLSQKPYFLQYGYIIYTLQIGYVPVKIHKQPFMVTSQNSPYWDWVENEN